MPILSKPRHGDPVVDVVKNSIAQGIPTAQFQEFLDELEEAANLSEVIDVTTDKDYEQTPYDNGIFCTGNIRITMIDPALAFKQRVTVKNETGAVSVVTIVATKGTVETTILNDTEVAEFAPRSYGWAAV